MGEDGGVLTPEDAEGDTFRLRIIVSFQKCYCISKVWELLFRRDVHQYWIQYNNTIQYNTPFLFLIHKNIITGSRTINHRTRSAILGFEKVLNPICRHMQIDRSPFVCTWRTRARTRIGPPTRAVASCSNTRNFSRNVARRT